MNILEKKKKISKNQQKINSIKKNGKSANEHLTQTVLYLDLILLHRDIIISVLPKVILLLFLKIHPV